MVNFIIIAIALFIVVKAINAARRNRAAEPEPAVAAAPTTEEKLLMEIRDLLRTGPART